VSPHEHPEPEEEHEAGNADPIGHERRGDPGGEQQPSDQDQLGVGHVSSSVGSGGGRLFNPLPRRVD
jgi:hypothetical protein